MAPEVVLAVFSLAVAAYALMPKSRRLELRAKVGVIDWTLLVGVIVLIHHTLYFPVLQAIGLDWTLGPLRWGFTPELMIYALLAFIVTWFWIRLHFGRLARSRITAFSSLAMEWFYQRQYAELSALLDRYVERLFKIYRSDFPLVNLKRRWSPPSMAMVIARRGSPAPPGPLTRLKRLVARYLPESEHSRDVAKSTVRRVMTADEFVQHVALTRPRLGLRVLDQKFVELQQFQIAFFRSLLDDSSSDLYIEIQNNQTSAGPGHRFAYTPDNPILWFLFSDVRVAERLHLFKTIGDFLLRLYYARFRSERDRFNEPTDRYPELEADQCAAIAVFRLFDFMISESAHQGIRWPMWLHYMSSFARDIERNLAPTQDVDIDSEFPTPYHYHMYIVVEMLCNWMSTAEVLTKESLEDQERSIPIQSSKVLGQVLHTVLVSDKFSDGFGVYLLEMCIARARFFSDENAKACFLQFLVWLRKGGREPAAGIPWPELLRHSLGKMDRFLYFEFREQFVEAGLSAEG